MFLIAKGPGFQLFLGCFMFTELLLMSLSVLVLVWGGEGSLV